MKRREFLIATPAVAAAIAVPALSVPQIEETPVMRAFREWEAYSAWVNTEAGDLPEPEWDAAVNRLTDLEDEIIETPAESAFDVVAKVAAYANFGQNGLPQDSIVWNEMRQLLGGVA